MKKNRRILAWIGILVLAGLYLSTVILALIGTKTSLTLLKISVLGTIAFPCLIYGYQLLYRVLKTHEKETQTSGSGRSSIHQVIEKTKNR